MFRQVGKLISRTMRLEPRCLYTTSETATSMDRTALDLAQAEALDKDICLLVDEKDNFIGTATKKECHQVSPDGNVKLHRAFSVFMFNERGDMLIQRRASHKVTYPDYYTNACCSHPLFLNGCAEDIINAARRRLNFELGIKLDDMDPSLFHNMTRIHYHDPGDGVWGEHEIDHIIIFQAAVKVKPNSDEISEIVYIPKKEFNQFLPTLEGPLTPWFNMVRRYRLKLWWDNLHRLKELQEPNKIHKFDE